MPKSLFTEEEIDAFVRSLQFNEKGLIPAIAVDIRTNKALMLAYMNEETLRETLSTLRMVYFSRSKNARWRKGDTSGDIQIVKEAYTDCDNDALLFKVEQEGNGACHTGRFSCFFKSVKGEL